jgi:osmoprotectant transport system ATP-binding protein
MTPIAPGHVPKSAKTAVPISMTLTELLDVLDAYDTLLVEKNHQIVGQVSRADVLRYWSGQLQERGETHE